MLMTVDVCLQNHFSVGKGPNVGFTLNRARFPNFGQFFFGGGGGYVWVGGHILGEKWPKFGKPAPFKVKPPFDIQIFQ